MSSSAAPEFLPWFINQNHFRAAYQRSGITSTVTALHLHRRLSDQSTLSKQEILKDVFPYLYRTVKEVDITLHCGIYAIPAFALFSVFNVEQTFD
ncbi:hypothetical protein [Bacillus atrophaeus]|uniref:hypothetical protein n=1 Tax=Bacillus atrophaeus TaxID=1452 RepID=UPI001EFBD17C|nr:hypothetical protein [Bacillus atrophaeus]